MTLSPLDESERGGRKVALKLNIQKTKVMASSPITAWQIDGETVETVADIIFGGSIIFGGKWWLQPWNKRHSLQEKLWQT